MPLPPMLEPQMYLPPIRTSLKSTASPKPSPSRPAGVRKVRPARFLRSPLDNMLTVMSALLVHSASNKEYQSEKYPRS